MAGIKQPTDRSHFLLPDLGEGLVEAELIKWRVTAGEPVKEAQTLAEMQTDKALVEVPSPWAGTVSEICGKEGDIIKVGAVLVRYGAAVAKSAAAVPAAKAVAAPAPTTAATTTEDQGTVVGSMAGTLSVGDRFARRAPEHLASAGNGKSLATPAVRRIARELRVDINRVSGSGRGGRVTAGDVQASASGTRTAPAAAARTATSNEGVDMRLASARPAPTAEVKVDAQGTSQRIPIRGVRRKIAEALSHSVRTAVHFTATEEADVTALDEKRREYARATGNKLSALPFVCLAVCRALRAHPTVNSHIDDAAGEILVKGVVNLGIAVDTEAGLMVPVIHNADRLTVVELGESIKRLAERCRDRSITREESLGGTFTLSNVGSYGAMFATPIINYPEVGILAVGRAKERVLVKDGRFYAGLSLPLSISCDHRVVDGAEAARFLNTVVEFLESPDSLLG